ncbi:uncharacterized protein LOC119665244, partial [Teleopsis dalmanni]
MATLAAECDRFKIDVIGISEVRWNGTGEFTNQKGGVLMYSGMPDEQDPHIRGVAVYVRKNVKHSILCWKAISERIIVVRFRAKKFNMSLVQCYAPTEDSPLDQKEVFYSALERTLSEIPRTDVIILMSDFNAEITQSIELGSLFPHKTCHKVTWKSPAGNFESQIDHICISKRWSKVLCDVRNKRSADIDSDHYLVVAELKFNIPKHRYEHPQHTRRTYNTTKLNVGAVKNEMIERINNVSLMEDASIEETWLHIKTNLEEICKDTLGYRKNEQKEWLSANSWELIAQRRSLSRQIKKAVKSDKRNYYVELSMKAQAASEKGDMKELFKLTKQLGGISFQSSAPIENENGQLVFAKNEQAEVWKRHFEKTLNIIHNESGELTIPRHLNPNRQIDTRAPSVNEIRGVIISMKSGKAP